jgi:hypothetical protein
MAKRGQPGYGKMKQLEKNMDKFEPVFWRLMNEFATSKSKDDKRFFIQEFNKLQTKMIPQTIDGDGEGGAIKVTITNYGNQPPFQLPAQTLPTSPTPSD